MPDLPITYRGTVYPWHCDHMNHMNVMWYVGKFDEATWQFFSSIGLSRSRLSKEGTGMAAVEQRIEYKRELHAGDLITIRSAALEITEKSIRFCPEVTAHSRRHPRTGRTDAYAHLISAGFLPCRQEKKAATFRLCSS